MRTFARSWISGSSECTETISSKQRIAFANSSACISLIAASYASTALAKCFEAARVGDAEREEADGAGVLRDSTLSARFGACAPTERFDWPPLRAAAPALAFKSMDLLLNDGRLGVFLVALGFAFVAISRAEL